MDISIERLDLGKDDINRVAWLLYITDLNIMPLFFGKQRTAVPMLSKLISMGNTHFSYRYVLCAKYNGDILGILVGFDGKQEQAIDRACVRDYIKAMGVFKAIRAGLVAYYMERMLKKIVKDDEFYVYNLCVAPDCRSMGVGAALLNEVFKKHDKVSLDVSIQNTKGLAFYLRNGFEIKSEYKIKLFGRMLGGHTMTWTRKGD